MVGGYLAACSLRRAAFEWRGYVVRLPSAGIAASQVGLAVVDLALACGTLYVLLPESANVSFVAFLGLYMVALAVSVLSLVPGGLGVFESILVLLLPGVAPTQMLGALLAYRLVYYALPFVVAVALMSLREVQQQRHRLSSAWAWTQRSLDFVVPQAIALLVFGAGFLLLLSGATPAAATRLAALDRVIPLAVLEASHLAGSAVGVLLLILAHGLARRLDGAWQVTMVLLGAGALASLLKGLDYEEALLLGLVALALYGTRAQFYRKSSLVTESLSPAWLASAAIAVGASIWVGLLAYRHVPYASELWWQFALDGHAPRMLRASLLAVLLFGSLCGLAPAGACARLADPADRCGPRACLADHPRLDGHLGQPGAARRQVTALQRQRQVVRDVRHRPPQLGRHGRSGRAGSGTSRTGLALPRSCRSRRRVQRVLRGRRGKPAALRRCRPRAEQAWRGGPRQARRFLARGQRTEHRCASRTARQGAKDSPSGSSARPSRPT